MSWPTASLKDETVLITKGTTPTTLGYDFTDAGVPFLRAQNLVDGSVSVETDPLFVSQDTHEALGRSKIMPSDVLISIAGTIGRAAIVPEDAEEMNCNQAVAIVRPSPRIHRRFVLHWLSSADAFSQVSKGKVTGTISNLSLGQIGKLRIPLPPLDEQRRIAAILDKADALRQKRKQAIDLLDSLTQSIFQEMFGEPAEIFDRWPTTELGSISTEFRYGTSEKSQSDGYPTLRIPNVIGNRISVDDLKYVPVSLKEFDRLSLQEGDLLFVRTNGNPDYVGRCAVVDESLAQKSGFPLSSFIFASYLIRSRIDRVRANPVFIQSFLSGSPGRKALLERSKTSAGQYNINTKGLASIKIPMPPIKLQNAYLEKINKIGKFSPEMIGGSHGIG